MDENIFAVALSLVIFGFVIFFLVVAYIEDQDDKKLFELNSGCFEVLAGDECEDEGLVVSSFGVRGFSCGGASEGEFRGWSDYAYEFCIGDDVR